MAAILLAVIGCYVLAACMVHVAYRLSKSKSKTNKHYILVSENNDRLMEWYLRSFQFYARRTGSTFRLTVVDRGSTDDTVAIADRLAVNRGHGLTVQDCRKELEDKEQTESGMAIRKRLPNGSASADHLLWTLRSEGIVKDQEQPVVVDLQNPSDLFKMPF
ncbi:hypothetical protein ACFSL6_07025 [Paenibacillus thailandensis]|uniref:Glycosyltransferase family 2 protein n=1 Tax=Paenibacillus thailandensis TaxID=393250 RepID=A0ABW5R3R8_9BACL